MKLDEAKQILKDAGYNCVRIDEGIGDFLKRAIGSETKMSQALDKETDKYVKGLVNLVCGELNKVGMKYLNDDEFVKTTLDVADTAIDNINTQCRKGLNGSRLADYVSRQYIKLHRAMEDAASGKDIFVTETKYDHTSAKNDMFDNMANTYYKAFGRTLQNKKAGYFD